MLRLCHLVCVAAAVDRFVAENRILKACAVRIRRDKFEAAVS